jgi:hypothetical protein
MDNKILETLSELGKLYEESSRAYEAENDAWWNNLSEKEREDAFYAVVKRIYKGEIVEKGSYRYVLYDVFGFDFHMYARGMDCGYMYLHNAIFDGENPAEVTTFYEGQ